MSDRLIKILVGALAVLLVGWGAARFLAGRGGSPEAAPFDLASAAELELDSVAIAGGDETIRLTAAGDGWTVNGHEAVADAGVSLIRALEEARIGQLASRNQANHERLGVSEGSGQKVTLFAAGSEQVSIFIGGKSTFDQGYIRPAGEDEVYMIRGSLVNLANRSLADWRNKELITASRDDIWRIEYAYPEAAYSLTRDSAGWRFEPSGAEADAAKISSLLNQLAGLRVLGFAADSVTDTLTWEPGAGRVRMAGPAGADLGELEFYKREDTGYYVRRTGSPAVYTLSTFTVEEILKSEEELAVQKEEE